MDYGIYHNSLLSSRLYCRLWNLTKSCYKCSSRAI